MKDDLLIAIIASITSILSTVISNWDKLRADPVGESKRFHQKGILLTVIFSSIGTALLIYSLYNYVPIKTWELRGFYKDRSLHDNSVYATNDDITIKLYRDGSARGQSTSPIKEKSGQTVETRFNYSGYWITKFVALAYQSDAEPPQGVGFYLLEQNGQEFTGLIGVHDTNGNFLSPYVAGTNLSANVSDSPWLSLWPNVFKRDVQPFSLDGTESNQKP